MNRERGLPLAATGRAVVPLPSSVLHAGDNGELYVVAAATVHFGAPRRIVFTRTVVDGGVTALLGDVIAVAGVDVLRRRVAHNVCVSTLTVEFVASKPARNDVVSVALLWSGAGASSSRDLWRQLAVSPSATMPLFRMPMLCLQRSEQRQEDAAAGMTVTRTTSVDELARMLTCANLRQHCTAQTLLQSRCTTIKPSPVELVPELGLRMPREMIVGMDVALLHLEYLETRNAKARDDDGDAIAVRLFRRAGSRSQREGYVPTNFGFWLLYFQDVVEERRPNVLPEAPEYYATEIRSCHLADDDGGLATATMVAPRALLVQLYTTLLARLAEEATARLLAVTPTVLTLLMSSESGVLEGLKATFTLTYWPLTLLTDKHVPESVESLVDVATVTVAAAYGWS